jgi:hypothetical protein
MTSAADYGSICSIYFILLESIQMDPYFIYAKHQKSQLGKGMVSPRSTILS